MIWHPPISTPALLVMLTLGVLFIAGGFLWARRHVGLASPAGLATIGLRAAAFLLLLFFLLQPSKLPEPRKITTRRALAVAIDSSGSMSKPAAARGPSRLDTARELLAKHNVPRRVGTVADITFYAFDSQPRPIKADAIKDLTAEGRGTDLTAAIEGIVRLHENDDLAGVLLFTDGRQTQGSDPKASLAKSVTPLFIVPLGEKAAATSGAPEETIKDLSIEAVSADPRVIFGRTAQVAVSVRGVGYGPRQAIVELLEGNDVVSSSTVALDPRQPRRQALFTLKPSSLGAHRYRARVVADKDDANPANNEAGFTIEVVDPVNRLLYLDRLRHERRFLKPILDSQRGLKYTSVVQQDPSRVMVDGNDPQMKRDAATFSQEQLRGIKAIILGDLPASALTPAQAASLVDWVDKGGSLLLLGGPSSLGPQGLGTTAIAKALPVSLDPARYVETDASVDLTPEGAAHPAFQKVKGSWSKAAPLLSRFIVGAPKPAATVLMATTDESKSPIVVSQAFGHGKAAVVLTDSTWRWQLGFDPAKAGAAEGSEHALFWRQLIDWLLPDLQKSPTDNSQLQLITDRTEYELNDTVVMMATVRNTDGGPATGAAVEFVVASPDGRPIVRQGKPDNQGVFTAEFPAAYAGSYEAQATARDGGRVLGTERVSFRVINPSVEFNNTDPDRALLAALADQSKGRMLEPADLEDLVRIAALEPREVLVQPNAEKDAESAWDRWWLLALFVMLVSGEWYLRRSNQWV